VEQKVRSMMTAHKAWPASSEAQNSPLQRDADRDFTDRINRRRISSSGGEKEAT
jgi:hypothetical protein